MTENYENDTIVFAKRLSESNDLQQQHQQQQQQQQNQNQMICNERAKEYIRELNAERNRMDKKFPIADRLIEIEIERVQATGRIPQSSREQKYADIYREKPLRITQKVLVPIREHPKFNFVGKLLGPKGNSMKRLQEETLCKMTVLGRNSMRDRIKEEELRCSMDPKYAHLNSDLHVEISTIAPPAEAYARMAYAMAEIRKYLIPDSNDGIRQEQLRELMNNNSASGNNGVMGISSGLANCSLNNDHESKSYNKNMNSVQTRLKHGGGVHDQNKMHQHGYRQQPPPHHQQPSYVNHNNLQKSPMVPRQKVMSILENARQAMEENYRYRMYDNHSQFDQQNFDNTNYAYGHMHGPPQQIQHQQGHAPHLNHPLAQTS